LTGCYHVADEGSGGREEESLREEGLIVLPSQIALDGLDGECDGGGQGEKDGSRFLKFDWSAAEKLGRGCGKEEAEACRGKVEISFGECVAAEGVDIKGGKQGDAYPEGGEGAEWSSANEVEESGDGDDEEEDGCDDSGIGESANRGEEVVGVEVEGQEELLPVEEHEVQGGEKELQRRDGPDPLTGGESAEYADAECKIGCEDGPEACAGLKCEEGGTGLFFWLRSFEE
jgi:hypothetical protein